MRQLLSRLLIVVAAGGSCIAGFPYRSLAGDGKPIKICYIAKNTGNPYFDPLIDGMKKAAEENGAEFTTVSPATADATSQLPLIKEQVQRGVNVIAISPNSKDALNRVFKE